MSERERPTDLINWVELVKRAAEHSEAVDGLQTDLDELLEQRQAAISEATRPFTEPVRSLENQIAELEKTDTKRLILADLVDYYSQLGSVEQAALSILSSRDVSLGAFVDSLGKMAEGHELEYAMAMGPLNRMRAFQRFYRSIQQEGRVPIGIINLDWYLVEEEEVIKSTSKNHYVKVVSGCFGTVQLESLIIETESAAQEYLTAEQLPVAIRLVPDDPRVLTWDTNWYEVEVQERPPKEHEDTVFTLLGRAIKQVASVGHIRTDREISMGSDETDLSLTNINPSTRMEVMAQEQTDLFYGDDLRYALTTLIANPQLEELFKPALQRELAKLSTV